MTEAGSSCDGAIPAVIARCLRHDVSAQKLLYEKYDRFVKSIVFRYVQDTETAKELHNDIFYRIFLKLHLYKPTGPFEGWIKKLAVNTILNKIKQHSKLELKQLADVDQEAFIAPEVTGKLNFNELAGLLFKLPDVQRIVFNLYVFEDLSHKEIAQLLSVTEGNSRWHLNQARQKLKAIINSLDNG